MAAANDKDRRQRLLDEHRQRAALVNQQERQQAERHRAAWIQLEESQRLARLPLAQTAKTVDRLRSVLQEFRPL